MHMFYYLINLHLSEIEDGWAQDSLQTYGI